MKKGRNYRRIFEDWFSTLPTYNSTGGLPARGGIAAALLVIERLKEKYTLSLNAHRASGQAQIQGLTPAAIKRILGRFGETRPFLAEGGRTNRGGPAIVESMLKMLRPLELEKNDVDTRNAVLNEFQRFLVEKVREYHGRKRLTIVYDPSRTTWSIIHDLLREADETGKAGPVAQYLVGAKLQLRFPEITVSNDSYSAADVQTRRLGDFQIGDTAFHVTVAPNMPVYEKCKRNLDAGVRVYLLVPDDYCTGARQNAEQAASGRIAVESIESFIANNIEELSTFTKGNLISGFRRLLETYNRRVNEVEMDKSMLVDIPANLK